MTAAEEARSLDATLGGVRQRQELAESVYPLLVRTARRLKLRRLTYRCRQRCLLLDAIETPEGIVLHQKRHKSSPVRNAETSSPAGRLAGTEDGDRRWTARTYLVEASALAVSDEGAHLDVACDHTVVALRSGDFWRDWEAGATEVRLPRAAR